MNNKDTEQTAHSGQMHRLICIFIVCIWNKTSHGPWPGSDLFKMKCGSYIFIANQENICFARYCLSYAVILNRAHYIVCM